MGEIIGKGALALLPIIWLIVALTGLKMAGHKACVGALIITIVESLFIWKMPVVDCGTSALEGFASALWPIILVIIAAIFTYNLSLKTGPWMSSSRCLPVFPPTSGFWCSSSGGALGALWRAWPASAPQLPYRPACWPVWG